MDMKYLVQVVYDEPGKKNQVGFLCYNWLKECYYLSYNLLGCNLDYQLKKTALDDIRKDKKIIIDNIENINDRKIISVGIILVEARVVDYNEVHMDLPQGG